MENNKENLKNNIKIPLKTHLQINRELCGEVIELKKDVAKIKITTTELMKVDKKGLIHGGFIFGLADFAAMAAVNEPTVVLGAAEVKFLEPVKVGEELVAEAIVDTQEKTKYLVEVQIWKGPTEVFQGKFTCFVKEKHVLENE